MNAMTAAEKQRRYRERKKVKEVAENLFEGRTFLTIEEFLAGVEFDEREFYAYLWDESDGEETEECREEKEAVRQEAYDEVYKEVYTEVYDQAYHEALADGDEEEDAKAFADEEAKAAAHEEAMEAANEAEQDWKREREDYDEVCIEYPLQDLLAAYRYASGI